jgi:hypothetical protein
MVGYWWYVTVFGVVADSPHIWFGGYQEKKKTHLWLCGIAEADAIADAGTGDDGTGDDGDGVDRIKNEDQRNKQQRRNSDWTVPYCETRINKCHCHFKKENQDNNLHVSCAPFHCLLHHPL